MPHPFALALSESIRATHTVGLCAAMPFTNLSVSILPGISGPERRCGKACSITLEVRKLQAPHAIVIAEPAEADRVPCEMGTFGSLPVAMARRNVLATAVQAWNRGELVPESAAIDFT